MSAELTMPSAPEGFDFERPDEQWLARVRNALRHGDHAPADEEASPADHDGYAAGTRLGSYELVRQIGAGGMGTVWLARRADGLFEREVALKLIKRGMDTDAVVRRFRTERHVLATLAHSHIGRLYDGGSTADGRPFLVMEYVEGLPIAAYCEAHGLDIEARLRLFRQVCLAVHHAHRHLILHRDLKPGNILVAPDGTPKLLDFGIAKLLDEEGAEGTSLTATDVRALTPRYASPEQVRGERLTTATDVYSLGVVLYELLTGRAPYQLDSGSHGEVERAVLMQEPARPSAAAARREDLPPAQRRRLQRRLRGDLDSIVLTALQKDAARRYPSAEQLAEDLRRHLDGSPLLARSPGVLARTIRLIRRRRGAVVAASAGGLLGVALAAAFVVYWFLMPAWAASHLKEARLAIVGGRVNHETYNIIFFNAPEKRAPHRQRSVVEGLKPALEAYDAALRLRPRDPLIRLERGVLRLAQALEQEPSQLLDLTASLRRELPLTCAYAEDWQADGERPSFADEELAAADPVDLRCLGFLALLWDDLETTIDAWTQLDLETADPLVEASLGNIYLALDQPELAYPRLLSVHRAYPEAGNLTAYLADAAARCGDFTQARRLLDIAAGQSMTDLALPQERTRMLCLLAEGEIDAAIELYHDSHLNRYSPVATIQLAAHFERSGQDTAALRLLAERLEPDGAGQAPIEKYVRLMEAWWVRLAPEDRPTFSNLPIPVIREAWWVRLAPENRTRYSERLSADPQDEAEVATWLALYADALQWLERFPDPHPICERAGWTKLAFPVEPEALAAAQAELLDLAGRLRPSGFESAGR